MVNVLAMKGTQMSNKSAFKQFFKGKEPSKKQQPPREELEINKEYTALAQQLGAETVQAENLKRKIQYIIGKIDELGAEMNERIKLDAKNKQSPVTPEKTEETPSANT